MKEFFNNYDSNYQCYLHTYLVSHDYNTRRKQKGMLPLTYNILVLKQRSSRNVSKKGFVSGLKSFNISFWDSMSKFLISDVISSFKESLRLSRRLFSIIGDFGLEGPATSISRSIGQELSATTGETKPSITFSTTSC